MSSFTIFGFTVAEVVLMREGGLSMADIKALAAASPSTGSTASGPVKAATVKAATPDWLVARGERKAARRALAASMRASGEAVTGPAWAQAKKAAGITASEKAAHKAFVASKR